MVVADLHIHSRYARSCSRDLSPEELNRWAKLKGVTIIATGDITHPLWRREMRRNLVEHEKGFYVLNSEVNNSQAPRFVLQGEVALMFRMESWNGTTREARAKGRRVHMVFLAPSFEAVERLVAIINEKGKLASDGRPILSMSCRDFVAACTQADPDIVVFPAHVWTPWFGLLGSKSGFNSAEEAFEDMSHEIKTAETGLSADPAMCWRLKTLNDRVLVSSSDAHSAPNIMREATLLNGCITSYNYDKLKHAITSVESPDYYGTLEFFPQEGKYHADGHASCKVVLEPARTNALNGRCPQCGQLITVGVEHRVDDISDYEPSYKPSTAGKVIYSVPLQEIIAEAVGKGKHTKTVQDCYTRLISSLGPEYAILHELQEIPAWVPERIVEGIYKVRKKDLFIEPGYDGLYGVVRLFTSRDNKIALWE